MRITPPADQAALKVVPSGAVPQSVSVGGAINLDNTLSRGAGLVLFSNQGNAALGRLFVVNQANPQNPQAAARIQQTGTGHALSIFHDPAGGAGDATAEALDVVSTNELDTVVGVRGRQVGRATVKVTHDKPDSPDGDAAVLTLSMQGAGTACQGLFIGNDAGDATTGPLLHVRNGAAGTERLLLSADGQLELPVQGYTGGVVLGSDAALYRSAPGVLATNGGIQAQVLQGDSLMVEATTQDPPAPAPDQEARIYVKNGKLVVQWNKDGTVLYTTIPLDTNGPYPAVPLITTDTTAP
jgi:Hyaluronidase protein (HylP)